MPVHPIHYTPTELLQDIFELAVEKDQEGFLTALSISHTCQRWRGISLETPRLWAYLGLPIRTDDSSVQEFLDRMQPRIKEIPPVVAILNINESSCLQLNHIPIHRFTQIERLSFTLENGNAASALSNALWKLQEDLSQTLELVFIDNPSGCESWRLNDIIDQLSPLHLILYNPPTFFLTVSDKWNRIRSLVLKNVRKIHLLVTLHYFRGLETLEVRESNILLPTGGPDLTLNDLKTLEIRQVINIEQTLEKLTFPNLVTFDVDTNVSLESINSFSFRHPFATILVDGSPI